MKNKLLFTLQDFNNNISIIANNHLDLNEYLCSTYDWYSIRVNDNSVEIVERAGFDPINATLEWIKCI